jgi:D-psicose/D-tagatose/L-ribulose 3-epimerase
MGADLLSGPLYSPVGYFTGRRRTQDEWKWAVESWQQLAGTAADARLEIGLEPLNRFETYFLNTVGDAAAFCDQVGHPGIGLLVDTFHANIEEKAIGEALRLAAPHLKHVHTCENDRGIPGSGHVAWAELFAAVHEVGYNRWLTIESFGFSLGPLSAAASIWRDIAPTPDAIAFEGVKFLRRASRCY